MREFEKVEKVEEVEKVEVVEEEMNDARRRESRNGSHLRLGYGGQWMGRVGEREKEGRKTHDAGKTGMGATYA